MKKGLSLLIFFLFIGCSQNNSNLQDEGLDVEKKQNIPLLYYPLSSVVSNQLRTHPPEKVAILPPTLSPKAQMNIQAWDDVNPPQLFRTVFYGRFCILPFKDIDIKQIDRLLLKQGILPENLPRTDPVFLCKTLGADALIYIHLTEIENVNTGIHDRTEYAATLKMIDPQTKELLWEAELKQNMFGGLISKSSQVVDFFAFEKENRNRPLAFRKVAESWSYRVIQDLKEKLNEYESETQ